MIDLRGKPSAKFTRKGMFRDEHFDPENNFLYVECDKVTNKVLPSLFSILFYGMSSQFCESVPDVMSRPATSFSAHLITIVGFSSDNASMFLFFVCCSKKSPLSRPRRQLAI
jgi:hypothetical protein